MFYNENDLVHNYKNNFQHEKQYKTNSYNKTNRVLFNIEVGPRTAFCFKKSTESCYSLRFYLYFCHVIQ